MSNKNKNLKKIKRCIWSTVKNEKSPWKNRSLKFSFFVLHSSLYTFLFQHTIHFYYILFLSNYVKQLSSKRLCITTLYTQDLSQFLPRIRFINDDNFKNKHLLCAYHVSGLYCNLCVLFISFTMITWFG